MNSKWVERLKLTAQGMTAEEVALKQSVSVQAVNASLLNARRKLNARNTTEAVYRACKVGLIVVTFVISPVVHSFIQQSITDGYNSNSNLYTFDYRRGRKPRRTKRERKLYS